MWFCIGVDINTRQRLLFQNDDFYAFIDSIVPLRGYDNIISYLASINSLKKYFWAQVMEFYFWKLTSTKL